MERFVDLDKAELMTRYDRQMRLEGWNQQKLSVAKVLVAGIGALGCEVAKNLALMGVGELLLVDNDVVELSNLSRQMLYSDDDISHPKALVAEKKIAEMNPLVKVRGIQTDVRKLPEEAFAEVDVIVSAVDNWPTRRWLNSMAVLTKKPLVDVATDGFYGNVQVVVAGETSCLECHAEALIPADVQASECSLRRRTPSDLVTELREKGLEITFEEAEALFRHNVKTTYDIKFAPQTVIDTMDSSLRDVVFRVRDLLNPKMPALQTVSAAVSAVGVFEVIRILHGGSMGKPVSGLMMFDGLKAKLSHVRLHRNPSCHVCGEGAESPVELSVSKEETIADIRERVSDMFMFPDTKIQHGARLLDENADVKTSGLKDGDILYIHSSRRAMPVMVKVKIVETGH
ncbi:MAG: HesA/MoeB/ThiF family protein [Candidatus Caldarchaeum sp.]|nr:HesA/MoeB/ThiF family protein [Candidatus Caldarchaeum sp.]